MSDPWTGERLGNYAIGECLGRGGMASVYAASHVALGTEHAVKLLASDLARNQEIRARFLREGRAQARFRHPGIVRVTDTINDVAVGLVMERLRGRSVRDLLEKGPLRPDEAVFILEHIAEAVDYAHSQAVVHRDLKPANLFLAERDGGEVRPTLIDFGVARMEELGRLTRAGTFIGTPRYMSPEQFENPSGVNGRSDTFSLAISFYEMLAGFTPHPGSSPASLALSMMNGRFDRISKCSDAPEALDEVFEQALAPEPDDRFPDAVSFAAAASSALAKQVEEPEVQGLKTSEGPLMAHALTWPPIPESQVKPILAKRTGSGNRCRQCGLDNALDQRFCLRCRTAL